MQRLKTKFKRYRWLLLLAAGVVGLFGGDGVRELPPAGNLMSAIVALYAMWRNERDQVADQVVERIWHKLGEQLAAINSCQESVAELRTVAGDHAGHLDRQQDWLENYAPSLASQPFAVQPVLRPAAR